MRDGLVLTLAALLLLAVTGFAAEVENEDVKLLGDEGDGSLAQPVHRIALINDEGDPVTPDDEPAMAFSAKESCGVCHTYDKIGAGWHFNADDPNVDAGRPGQPWIYVDLATATQIPLSYRDWPGVFKPSQVGLTKWDFTKQFARHLPGGGVGEADTDDPDEMGRQMVSGMMEINCLGCHNGSQKQDQAEFAMQMRRENFRWGAAAASGIAAMTGSAAKMDDMFDPLMPDTVTDPKLIVQVPTITYHPNVFEDKNRVFLDIVREVPSERCYYCHSNINASVYGNEKWEADEDIHLSAGMTCVDCHRNGLDHNIVRGYDGEDSTNHTAAHSSCEGCHIGGHDAGAPTAGRFGAPKPAHIGIPAVHFEKLTCTACHSGPWPGMKTDRVKSSQTHALGTRGVNKSPDALPHIEYPVLATQADGKIAPHKLVWPAFWGADDGNDITPLDVSLVKDAISDVMAKVKFLPSGDWPELNDEAVAEAMGKLAEANLAEGKIVYVCGGKVFSLGEGGELVASEDKAAEPYLWPMGHNVRPASQSLGVRYCTDCHSTEEGFFFGEVAVDGPLAALKDATMQMTEFQDVDPLYTKLFAQSFVFRPMLKIVALCSVALIGVVLLLYGLKALCFVTRVFVGKD